MYWVKDYENDYVNIEQFRYLYVEEMNTDCSPPWWVLAKNPNDLYVLQKFASKEEAYGYLENLIEEWLQSIYE